MKLNPQQLQAVNHSQGPLLIVAGAGTGKTTVITQRVKYLIQTKKVDPQHIFVTSFTQKSAQEMLERLDTVMPLGYREPWLGTFHSLCERLLRLEGLEIGLDPGFKVMTATNQWIFIKHHLFDFKLNYFRPLGNPTKFITALIKFISRLQDEATTADEFKHYLNQFQQQAKTEEAAAEAHRLQELYQAYLRYHQLKLKESVMDFGDLIAQTVHLFESRPNLKNRYQQQFQHLLVDEFQDTNYAQYQLIKLLAPPQLDPNLIVVGDDDQAIYKFRGASVSNILAFRSDYPKSDTIVLEKNYRSTKPILDVAYRTIINNDPDRLESRLKIPKQLSPAHSLKGDLQLLHFDTLEDEVAWTVNRIIQLVTRHRLTYQNIAILARANSQLEPYALAIRSAGLPYQLISNSGLFDQPEIKDLITFLKVLKDPDDAISLLQLSQSHVFDLADSLMFDTFTRSKRLSTTVWHELQQLHQPPVAHFVKTILDYQQLAIETPVSTLLYQFIEAGGYLKPYISSDTVANQLKLKNLNLFFNQLKRFELDSPQDRSLLSFLEVLDLWLEAGENPGQAQIEDIDTISLMTIHAAKGLEFEAVFMGSLVAGRFPTYHRKDKIQVPDQLVKETLPVGDEHLQEERRLFYVGLTRAKRFLYLTFAKDVGGARARRPSGFLAETGLKITPPATTSPQLPFFTPPTPDPQTQIIKQGRFVINKTSYSQIDTFKVCPLKFKYRYLLSIPAKPHHSLSFGRTIHQTLHQFHQLEMQGQKLTRGLLLSLYDQNFIPDGYDSPKHLELRYQQGKQALSDYFTSFQKALAKPYLLEQQFSLNINSVRFVGKIDRIDQGSKGEYHLIDYKTGAPKDQKAADKDDQLTIYNLAAKEALGLKISSSSLYFLEDGGHKFTTTRVQKALDQAHTKLKRHIHQLQTSDFAAKPDPVKCGFCEYRSLCPFAAKSKH